MYFSRICSFRMSGSVRLLGLGLGSLLGCVGIAKAQQQTLPPVRLQLSQPVAATPTTEAPAQSPVAGGAYPQPGRYAQPPRDEPVSATPAPATATPATTPAQGTYAQPGRYAQPTQDGPVTAAPAVLADPGPRRISLGYKPASATPAPMSSTPVPETTAVAATTKSVPPPPGMRAMKADVPPHEKPQSKRKVASKTPELIVLPGKPMLDEYGVQRVDPEGNPMFQEAVKQQRDKHGKPLFADGKPVFQTADDLGFDERGRRIKPAKAVEAPKNVVAIQHGAFMVDGIVGKVQLNYDIGELHYLYLYVPDTGVTVVSDAPFPGATLQRGAFRGNALSVKADEHMLKVSSDNPFFGKKPVNAYVMVDRGFTLPHAKYPVFGYGATTKEPYEWPGSKAEEKLAGASDNAPAVPKDLRPKLLDATPSPVVASAPAVRVPAPVEAAPAPAEGAPENAAAVPAAAQVPAATDQPAATPESH